MNYSVFLGPDKRHIPDGKWDEYKANGKIDLYDLVFRSLHQDGWYKATLTDGTVEFTLGQVFHSATRGREWSCIPNPTYCDKEIVGGYQIAVRSISQQGFATRLRAAEYLMRRLGFTNPEAW